MTTVAQDSFTEAGSGTAALTTHTAETGGTWAAWWNDNAAVSLLVDKTNDRYQTSAADFEQGDIIAKLGSVSVGDGDLYVTAPITADGTALVAARILGTNNAYVAAVKNNLPGASVYRLTAGALTVLGTYNASAISAPIRVRLNVSGSSPTSLSARWWSTGGAEPGTWGVSTSDSTAGNNSAATGAVGVGGSHLADGDVGTPFPGYGDDFLVTTADTDMNSPAISMEQTGLV